MYYLVKLSMANWLYRGCLNYQRISMHSICKVVVVAMIVANSFRSGSELPGAPLIVTPYHSI